MPVAIESFEVVPEAEQPQRSTPSQPGGSAPPSSSQLVKQIEETTRLLEARRTRLRAT